MYLLSWNGCIPSPDGHCCPNWKSVLNRMETDRAPPAAGSLRHVPRIIHDEVSLVSMCGRLVETGRDRQTVYRGPAAACSIQRGDREPVGVSLNQQSPTSGVLLSQDRLRQTSSDSISGAA